MQSNLADVAAQLEAGLMASLRRIANGDLLNDVAAECAKRGKELLAEEFESKTAPSGAPWLPQKHDYGNPLLDRTGELKGSGRVMVIGPNGFAAGFQLTFFFSDEKAPWQHYGTKRNGKPHIPARPLVPAEGDEERWRADLESTMQTTLDGWLAANVHV